MASDISVISAGAYNFVRITPLRSIGDLVAQATLEEVHGDDLELVDHPVDRSSSITDHAFKIPEEVRIHVIFSESNPGGSQKVGVAATPASDAANTTSKPQLADTASSGPLQAYSQLLRWQANATLLTIQTGKRQYTNMVIKNLNVATTSRTENCVDATITARRVILVKTVVTSVAAPKGSQKIPNVTNPVARRGEVPIGKKTGVQSGPTIKSLSVNPRDRR